MSKLSFKCDDCGVWGKVITDLKCACIGSVTKITMSTTDEIKERFGDDYEERFKGIFKNDEDFTAKPGGKVTEVQYRDDVPEWKKKALKEFIHELEENNDDDGPTN